MTEHDDATRTLRATLGGSFRAGGERYARVRPGYPVAAVDWLVPAGARDVVDIGAGTGKLTRLLAERGLTVVAVDPSADMLGQIPAQPSVTTVVGTGEATGVPEQSGDLATFAQAWHWVDPVAGCAELVRVLRPGGRVGMLWNVLDVSVPWLDRFARAMRSIAPDSAEPTPAYPAPELSSAFGPVEQKSFRWSMPLTREDLTTLPETRSYWLSATEEDRALARVRIAEVLRDLPAQPDGTIDLAYVTLAFRADLKGS